MCCESEPQQTELEQCVAVAQLACPAGIESVIRTTEGGASNNNTLGGGRFGIGINFQNDYTETNTCQITCQDPDGSGQNGSGGSGDTPPN
jgi:hypothetical protein